MNELSDFRITDEDVAQKGVVAAPDRLTGTAAQNKAVFDRLIRDAVKEKYNALITALEAHLVWEPYDAEKEYVPGNKVVYNGSSYLCTAACADVLPTDTAYWRPIAARGADGDGAGDMRGAVYDPRKVEADVFAYVDKWAGDTYSREETLSGETARQFVKNGLSKEPPETPDEAFGILVGKGRYGFKIDKNNSDPSTRVEYLYDAIGMTPAHMDFEKGTFDYGDWGDVWFVKDNRPLMLNPDGTVAYYLDPNNYELREDGETPSDINDAAHNMNAMAQFPLCWVKRWEDDRYEYTVISGTQCDETYKAYAHTRMDGTIAPYFYWSLFHGSHVDGRLRSLKGYSTGGTHTVQQDVDAAVANGPLWYTYTWSMWQLMTDLMVLMGKSTNTQKVFGNGNYQGGTYVIANNSGLLFDKGQFWGSSGTKDTLKVFHTERACGESDRVAGIIRDEDKVFVKMTRENSGYRVSDTVGMIELNLPTLPTDAGYIKGMNYSEYGRIPIGNTGGEGMYYCGLADYRRTNALAYGQVGLYSRAYPSNAGAFTFSLLQDPNLKDTGLGTGLTCEMPPEEEEE